MVCFLSVSYAARGVGVGVSKYTAFWYLKVYCLLVVECTACFDFEKCTAC
jgi:hypothetical protein